MIWKIFYNIIIVPLLWTGFQVWGLFNMKARRAIRGRKGLFTNLEIKAGNLKPAGNRIWFHVSSMGEFEQAKPIIGRLKNLYSDIQIVVTFFSSSGYDHSLSFKMADIITYIPFDSYSGAERFVRILKPTAAVLVRYDVWPNHVWALKKMGVPVFMVSATHHKTLFRELPIIRNFRRNVYNSIDYILTVSENDERTFRSFNLPRPLIKAIGDTRYDQVQQRSAECKSRRIIDPKILSGKKVFVIGSSWKEDESVLFPAIAGLFESHPELLVIVVPHEPTVENLERAENELEGKTSHIRFSELSGYDGENVILIDSVGILMVLYNYAHIAYVGGSFKNGIHNVLEPASYGIPILFGPKHENSQEAAELVKAGAAFVGNNDAEFITLLEALLRNDEMSAQSGRRAADLVARNVGATEKFISYLIKILQ